jgi:hypothetical protein
MALVLRTSGAPWRHVRAWNRIPRIVAPCLSADPAGEVLPEQPVPQIDIRITGAGKARREQDPCLAALVTRALACRVVQPSPDLKSLTAASLAPAAPFPRADASPTMYDTAGAASIADGVQVDPDGSRYRAVKFDHPVVLVGPVEEASDTGGLLLQARWRDVIVGRAHHLQGLTALDAGEPAHA